VAVSGHADTPSTSRPVTIGIGSATPYTTPVDVNPSWITPGLTSVSQTWKRALRESRRTAIAANQIDREREVLNVG
jgi:hypothetical protein